MNAAEDAYAHPCGGTSSTTPGISPTLASHARRSPAASPSMGPSPLAPQPPPRLLHLP